MTPPSLLLWPLEPAVWRIHTGETLDLIHQILRDEADERRLTRTLSQHIASALARAQENGARLPEQHLISAFGLSLFEVSALWLAVAPHLEPSLRGLLTKLQGNSLHDFVDGALCLRLLCEDLVDRLAHQEYFAPHAPLLRSRLLSPRRREVGASYVLTQELSPATHLLGWFLGQRRLSEGLAAFCDQILPPAAATAATTAAPPGLEASILPMLRGFWALPRIPERPAVAAVCGDSAPNAALWASLTNRAVLDLDGHRLASSSPYEVVRALHLAAQEAAMYSELLLVRAADPFAHPDSPHAPHLADALRHHPAAAAILWIDDTTKIHPALGELVLLRQTVHTVLTPDTARALWLEALRANGLSLPAAEHRASEQKSAKTPKISKRKAPHPPVSPADPGEAAAAVVAQQLSLTSVQIERAARLAALMHADQPDLAQDLPKLLKKAGQAQITQHVGALAERNEATLGFEGLILNTQTTRQLREILAAIRSRQLVIHQWRLGERIRRGTGITCLFDGDPGTGKTLSAEVIAAEAGLDLLRVNVSTIVDKYIGETEKHLSQIFEQVRPDVSLLLFDEADSLFAKRTEVSKSSDRYANMEINVLLQLIERYEGVTVLTTNLKRSIDPAFERRITFKVSFPMPEAPERLAIWRHLLPPHVPTATPIDYEFLAESMELTGGEIKNAILRAAYAAACDGLLLSMDHLRDAARREATSTGRLVRDDY